MTEILPFLFLGALEDAQSIENGSDSTFTHCLCVAKEARMVDPPSRLKYLTVFMEDLKKDNILKNKKLEECLEFLANAESVGNAKILVHCAWGINRSTTIVLAYLMKHKKMSLIEAYKHVKNRRSIISPNPHYCEMLLTYEKHIYGENSCSINDIFESAMW